MNGLLLSLKDFKERNLSLLLLLSIENVHIDLTYKKTKPKQVWGGTRRQVTHRQSLH